MKYILSIDSGTTSTRALLIDHAGQIVGIEQKPLTQHYPEHGWIEHNPLEILEAQFSAISQLLEKSSIPPSEIGAIGITNQRETTIIWEKSTGKPIWNGIVWNDRRTTERLVKIKEHHEEMIHKKTGLYVESYFSASKIDWILTNVEGARERARKGELLFGTVNTWLLWHLTNGEVFATDVSNASRTLIFNIHQLSWDADLLDLFDIPEQMLPEVRSNSEIYGKTHCSILPQSIPIASMIGDQQASLFGHGCFDPGDVKCTYGTGSFMMMHTGYQVVFSQHKLLSTIAWQIGKNRCEYAIEGLVYSAGSVVNWLKDRLGILRTASEIESLAFSVPDSGGVYFVSALNGLASPHWNEAVRGTLFGISASTNIGHIARAALESIAFQVADSLQAMQKDAGSEIKQIKCGGGMSENIFLMQIQSDLLGIDLAKSSAKEMTALGAGFLAGLAVGFWKDLEEIRKLWHCDRKFSPELKTCDVMRMKQHWKCAVKLAEMWADNQEI